MQLPQHTMTFAEIDDLTVENIDDSNYRTKAEEKHL